MTNKPNEETRIRLFEHEGGSNFCTTDLRVLPDGSLELSCYDIGEMAEAFAGHDDYEFNVTLRPQHKDKLLLALLKAKFGGDPQASGHFRDLLEGEGIPYGTQSWP